jgi:hypothetical protein
MSIRAVIALCSNIRADAGAMSLAMLVGKAKALLEDLSG